MTSLDDLELCFTIDNVKYSIELNQGFVVRREGSLFADWGNDKFSWINPKLTSTEAELKHIAFMCGLFVELYVKTNNEYDL